MENQRLIMEETQTEVRWRVQVQNNSEMDEAQKAIELRKLEESFYYRRIINSAYFKHIKNLILSRKYK